MGCNQYDHIVNPGLWRQDYALFRVDSSRARNHRALIVSDAPETLYPWEPNPAWDTAHGIVTGEYEVYGTLYRCEVPANSPGDYRFRVYLWHENRLNPPPEATVVTFGIAVSSANPLAISELRDHVSIVRVNSSANGKCLAKAHLLQSLDQAMPNNVPSLVLRQ